MTTLIYLEDSYKKEFDAKVTKAEAKNIILDKTIFYPNSGGQPGDTGVLVINGKEYKVINTKKAGPETIHEVDQEGIKEGDQVTGLLDWARRYRFMRGHTACHVLSYIVNKETGALITGNQISEEKCRIDFDLENFDREQISSFEKKANAIIAEGVEVNIKVLPREEAFQIPSVLKLKNVLPPSIENIRIVDIAGYDAQACGGTHVKNTSEIGTIEITKAENKGKNNRRVYFKLKD
ncbi:alanyl-tRNA editing protein [Candidatus Woesearchaeota archaeon]|jgi:misacylated tRNA(Ala) deacylase|nr:alanyl-tRNA editing protein [Candidatus Woesearchaeota archaeon]